MRTTRTTNGAIIEAVNKRAEAVHEYAGNLSNHVCGRLKGGFDEAAERSKNLHADVAILHQQVEVMQAELQTVRLWIVYGLAPAIAAAVVVAFL